MKVDVRALYRDFTTSAHRLELHDHYEVPGDEERQRAFHEGRPIPEPGEGKQATLDLIAAAVAAGKHIGRIHVVDLPLATPYLRWEIGGAYPENAAAGEDVRIAVRDDNPDLAALVRDFAIFDAESGHGTVIFYDYDDAGRLLGYEASRDPATVRHCWEQYTLAWAYAVRLGEFLAEVGR